MSTTIGATNPNGNTGASSPELPPFDSLHGLGTPDKPMLYVFTGVPGGMPDGFPSLIAEEFDAVHVKKDCIKGAAYLLSIGYDVVLERFYNNAKARGQAIRMAQAGRAALMAVNVSTPFFVAHSRLEESKQKRIESGSYIRPRFDPTNSRILKQMIAEAMPASVEEGIHYVMNIGGRLGPDPLLNEVDFRLQQLGLLEV